MHCVVSTCLGGHDECDISPVDLVLAHFDDIGQIYPYWSSFVMILCGQFYYIVTKMKVVN